MPGCEFAQELCIPPADASKFISGCMQALSAMVKLELPHVNVLTKMDICPDKVRCFLNNLGSCVV